MDYANFSSLRNYLWDRQGSKSEKQRNFLLLKKTESSFSLITAFMTAAAS